MKKLLLCCLCYLSSYLAKSQTQLEMNQAACKKYEQADKKLDGLYQQILKTYAADPVFIKAFKASQVAWLRFRNAQEEALYPTQPGEAKRVTYGSVYSMCSCPTLAELTATRNKQLQVWIDGVEEGETCAGSMRLKK